MGAIERSLKIAREREQRRRASDKGRRASDKAGVAADGHEPAALDAVEQSAALVMPAYGEVPYDPAVCYTNRIRVPDSPAPARSSGGAAYRVLRTRLLQRVRANDWGTIGVTSPGQGDGKSVTSLNLALGIAQEGNNSVFLIDLDMRNPKMCKFLGTTPPIEISRYLAEDIAPESVLFSIGVPNLTLAGNLKSTEDASELLARGRVETLFEYVRSVAPNPIVLVDLPPLLSTDDALVIAPKVDACLLVVSEGKTRRDGAVKALDLLSEFNLAGIVLNRSSSTVTDYYSAA